MKELLNASQASRHFGVTPNTVIRWFEDGLFPNAFRVGSVIRIPMSDIEALKAQGQRREAV